MNPKEKKYIIICELDQTDNILFPIFINKKDTSGKFLAFFVLENSFGRVYFVTCLYYNYSLIKYYFYLLILVALPITEQGVEDAAITTIQTSTTGDEIITIQTTVDPTLTSLQSTVEPEVTSFQSTTELEVTTLQSIVESNMTSSQSIIEPEVTSTISTNTTEEIPDTTSPPVKDVVEATTETQNSTQEITTFNVTKVEVIKDKLSEQIRKILKHYQQPEPVGFPGAPIPDPLSLPDLKKSVGILDMVMNNITVHGLSKFEVDQINVDLKNMTVRFFFVRL